jgi:hypothetical protein
VKPQLDVILVNWNTGDQLRTCLKSLTEINLQACELRKVVVVDNGSSDGSMGNLHNLSIPLQLISNRENRGFAAACNQGSKDSESDYLLFLNPDTALKGDSLDAPVSFLERQTQYGICGIRLVDASGLTARTCVRFPSVRSMVCYSLGLNRLLPRLCPGYQLTDWPHLDSRPVDHVIGAFYLVRRHLFEQLGGFDERFFVYLEDLDFSLRASKAGSPSFYLAEAQAFHKGGGTSEQIRATRLFYSYRSRLLYAFKHFNVFSAILLLVCTAFIEPFPRLIRAALRRSKSEAVETLTAHGRLLCALPGIIHRSAKR